MIDGKLDYNENGDLTISKGTTELSDLSLDTISTDGCYSSFSTTSYNYSGGYSYISAAPYTTIQYRYDDNGELTLSNQLEERLEKLEKNIDIFEKVVESSGENPDIKEDYDIVLNYLRTFLEKVMDNPEDIIPEVRELKKENQELRERIERLEALNKISK